ncbi:hypothetical protein GQ44DRAFT_208780 [Phaeosphaeriaceae sp. PMI808]|nr:hypothetical protein GQ44DRAFT_208780 [Phaeosphaeriaceae sp. PMI808]
MLRCAMIHWYPLSLACLSSPCDLVMPGVPVRSHSASRPMLWTIVPAVPLGLVVTALPHRAIPWSPRVVNNLPSASTCSATSTP